MAISSDRVTGKTTSRQGLCGTPEARIAQVIDTRYAGGGPKQKGALMDREEGPAGLLTGGIFSRLS